MAIQFGTDGVTSGSAITINHATGNSGGLVSAISNKTIPLTGSARINSSTGTVTLGANSYARTGDPLILNEGDFAGVVTAFNQSTGVATLGITNYDTHEFQGVGTASLPRLTGSSTATSFTVTFTNGLLLAGTVVTSITSGSDPAFSGTVGSDGLTGITVTADNVVTLAFSSAARASTAYQDIFDFAATTERFDVVFQPLITSIQHIKSIPFGAADSFGNVASSPVTLLAGTYTFSDNVVTIDIT